MLFAVGADADDGAVFGADEFVAIHLLIANRQGFIARERKTKILQKIHSRSSLEMGECAERGVGASYSLVDQSAAVAKTELREWCEEADFALQVIVEIKGRAARADS